MTVLMDFGSKEVCHPAASVEPEIHGPEALPENRAAKDKPVEEKPRAISTTIRVGHCSGANRNGEPFTQEDTKRGEREMADQSTRTAGAVNDQIRSGNNSGPRSDQSTRTAGAVDDQIRNGNDFCPRSVTAGFHSRASAATVAESPGPAQPTRVGLVQAGPRKWWEELHVIDITAVVDSGYDPGFLGSGVRVPQAPKFDGRESSFLMWSRTFSLHAKHCGLMEAFTSKRDVPMSDIELDLTPMVAKGYSVSDLRRAQVAFWYLFNAVASGSTRDLVIRADSPSKAWRDLNSRFLPSRDTLISLLERRLSGLKMAGGEDPSIFFSKLRETLDDLSQLGVHKSDREVCWHMLCGLTKQYSTLKDILRMRYPRDREQIEKHVRDKYFSLNLSLLADV